MPNSLCCILIGSCLCAFALAVSLPENITFSRKSSLTFPQGTKWACLFAEYNWVFFSQSLSLGFQVLIIKKKEKRRGPFWARQPVTCFLFQKRQLYLRILTQNFHRKCKPCHENFVHQSHVFILIHPSLHLYHLLFIISFIVINI